MEGVHGKTDEWHHRISAKLKKDQQIASRLMKLLQL